MAVVDLPGASSELRNYEPTVVNCYTLFDKFFPTVGMLDYTEGIYHDDPNVTFEQAQLNQINYVLDEVGCSAGVRVLEIGCGNGRLLDEVRRRGAVGVGITISPEQVALCRRRGLDVRLLDYKLLDVAYAHRFDVVIANGPIEHFVQPRDAARGLTDAIYRRMFALFHAAIDPVSPLRRFINTTIYFERPPKPERLLESPSRFPRGSDDRHWAELNRAFGGFYPTAGQLEHAASGLFELRHEVDGTADYSRTSEEWLRRIRSALRQPVALKILLKSLPFALRHMRQTYDMLHCMLVSESWNWQFREPDPPTRLLRQTWSYSPA